MASTLRTKANTLLCIALGVVVCVRHSAALPIPLPVVALLSLLVVFTGLTDKPRISIPLVTMTLVYAISLAVHPKPEFWLRAQRYVAFLIGLLCFSPLIQSAGLSHSRKVVTKNIFLTLTAMVGLSLVVWIYHMAYFGKEGIWAEGIYHYGFKGVFNMGMALSPSAAIVALYGAAKSLDSQCRRHTYGWTLVMIIGIIMCVAAGSRTSVAGLAISLIALGWINRRRIFQSVRTPAGITVAACGIIIVLAALPTALSVIKLKNAVGTSHESIFYSREQLWEDRWKEFCSSPLTGIGYANEFPSETNEGGVDKIEPGSSWLSLLSYGGIAGMAAFMWFFIPILAKLWRDNVTHKRPAPQTVALSLPITLLLFLIINASTEGWILFGGALMFPIFWLTISTISEMPSHRNNSNNE